MLLSAIVEKLYRHTTILLGTIIPAVILATCIGIQMHFYGQFNRFGASRLQFVPKDQAGFSAAMLQTNGVDMVLNGTLMTNVTGQIFGPNWSFVLFSNQTWAPISGAAEAPKFSTLEVSTLEFSALEVSTPEDSSPKNTSSEDSSPEDSTPEDSTPTDSTPIDSTPTDCTPIDSTPTDCTPIDSTPTDRSLIDSTPTDCIPIDSTPTDSTPTDSTPEVSAPNSATPERFPNCQKSPNAKACQDMKKYYKITGKNHLVPREVFYFLGILLAINIAGYVVLAVLYILCTREAAQLVAMQVQALVLLSMVRASNYY